MTNTIRDFGDGLFGNGNFGDWGTVFEVIPPDPVIIRQNTSWDAGSLPIFTVVRNQ